MRNKTQMDADQEGPESKTIVTALCWVSQGYAKPLLEGYEPDDKEMKKHSKL
jgi:hypothetical protein